MTIYFANPGIIDMNVVRVMGVSVKESDSAIGHFGTGLKFAIATLLRTGHSITIRAGSDAYVFSTRTQKIRGKDFEQVVMNDEALSFTTRLGRNWEPWQAYRELHSNTLDESGEISDIPLHGDTVVEVTGDAIEKEYLDRARLFLQHEPIAFVDGLEVHAGASRFIYYRGVRAGILPEQSLFTYNITEGMELSEDRNFKDLWAVEYAVETRLPSIPCKAIHDDLLSGGRKWDQCLNYGYCGAPSREFLQAAENMKDDAALPEAARTLLANHRQSVIAYPPCVLREDEIQKLTSAARFLEVLDVDMDMDDVTVTETLGPSVYGLYHKGQNRIYIARQSLDNGTRFIAATLYEEWVHKTHHLKDASRPMQQFLFDRLMTLAERAAA